jgi:hypothetical protein
VRSFSEEHFEELEGEIFSCIENIQHPECTLAEAGRFYEEAQEALRAHAILRLLVDADRDGFSTDLVLSGYARRAYLRRCAQRQYADYFLASSRSGALLDALAADAADLVGELVRAAAPDWRQGDEYEDDFCYQRLLGLLATGAPAAEIDALLTRFVGVADGDGARLAVCRALRDGDTAAFDTAFAELLLLRDQEVEADKDLAEESVAAALGSQLFVEGIAVLKLAQLRGIRVAREYPGCPILALRPGKRATPADEFAIP